MPKRIVDGEGLWGSKKILSLKEEHKPEYANWVPLAEANGTFELDPRKIWLRVYGYNRQKVTMEFVYDLLEDLVASGLLLAWEEDGKVYGFWDGQDKVGRLPGPSEQKKYKNLPPDPPLDCSKEITLEIIFRLRSS
jgi:hypothetical protein